jgi:hypothetical protein
MVASIMAKAQETPGKGLAGFVARCEMSDEWTPVAEIAKALDLYLRATNSFEHVSRQRLNAALTGQGFAYEANNKSKRTPARYGLKLPVIKSPHLASVG